MVSHFLKNTILLVKCMSNYLKYQPINFILSIYETLFLCQQVYLCEEEKSCWLRFQQSKQVFTVEQQIHTTYNMQTQSGHRDKLIEKKTDYTRLSTCSMGLLYYFARMLSCMLDPFQAS